MHSRMQFALWTAQAHWLKLSSLPARSPRSPSAGLLSRDSSSHLDLLLLLIWPRYKIQQLVIFSFMLLIIAKCFKIRRSLYKASCPLRVNSTSQFGIISKLGNGAFSPASRSLINIFNRTGPRTHPWWMPQVTGHQPEVAPFTIILKLCPSASSSQNHRII